MLVDHVPLILEKKKHTLRAFLKQRKQPLNSNNSSSSNHTKKKTKKKQKTKNKTKQKPTQQMWKTNRSMNLL